MPEEVRRLVDRSALDPTSARFARTSAAGRCRARWTSPCQTSRWAWLWRSCEPNADTN